jgi:hypothetical protein
MRSRLDIFLSPFFRNIPPSTEIDSSSCRFAQGEEPSGDPRPDDLTPDVGQAEIAALEAVGQAQVVQAEQVQHRGVKVVDVDGVAGDPQSDLVGLAVNLPARIPPPAIHSVNENG